MTQPSNFWLLKTRNNCEARALRDLTALGLLAYWPRVVGGTPLLPARLFVRDDGFGLDLIRQPSSVIDVVRHQGEPLRVPSLVLASIRAREDANGEVVLRQPPADRLIRRKPRSGVTILIDLLFRPMRPGARADWFPKLCVEIADDLSGMWAQAA